MTLVNCFLYSLLAYSFLVNGQTFDLGRHGGYLSFSSGFLGLFYFFLLAIYFRLNSRGGAIPLDAFNIFIILFSFLVLPGILVYGPINGSNLPILANTLSGIFVVLAGIAFETLSPDLSSRWKFVRFRSFLSPKTAFLGLFAFFALYMLCFVSGNFDRGGVLSLIGQIFSQADTTSFGMANQYRSELYHNSSNVLIVIGNYSGSVFGPLIALILSSHYFYKSSLSGKLKYRMVASFILLMPVLFCLGTGSRLMLLRTLLLYIIFYSIPLGFKLFNLQTLNLALISFAVLVISTSLLGRGLQGINFTDNIVLQTEKSLSRLFVGGKGAANMLVFEYYPALSDFEGLTPTIDKFLGSDFDGDVSVAQKLFAFRFSGLGTAGPQSFGEMYSAFGYIGMIILVPCLSVALLFLRVLFNRVMQAGGLIDKAFIAFANLSFGYMGYSDVASFKTIGLLYVSLMFVFVKFVQRLSK